jgi:hypothetical protein
MKRTLIIAIALVLGLALTITKANAAITLAVGDEFYVGLINDGIPSSLSAQVGYINTLIAQAPETGPTTVGTETYTRSILAGPFAPAVLAGAVKDESTPLNSTVSSDFQYVLAKYDQTQAGTLVWYSSTGFTGPVTVPSTFNGHAVSHISSFNNVPDGGVTLMLLGGALFGVEALRRRYKV